MRRLAFIAGSVVSVAVRVPSFADDDKPAALHVGNFRSGPVDGITDVVGVRLAHLTKIEGEGALRPGIGPVRTGATAILPNADPWNDRCSAATWYLNGNGTMTGSQWVDESGFLEVPVLLTSTLNVPRVADGVIDWEISRHPGMGITEGPPTPVVAECDDQGLNDVQGRHVHASEIPPLLQAARSGQFARGSVGAGTGMRSFRFKAGIGSSSRRLPESLGGYTVGVLVNANSGTMDQLIIAGVPVGKILAPEFQQPQRRRAAMTHGRGSDGSMIVVLATDTPLESTVLRALAKRTALGMARTGLTSQISSGDLMIAFSTTVTASQDPKKTPVTLERDLDRLDALYTATVDATESAIYDSLWNAKTMVGANGNMFPGLPHDRVRALLAARAETSSRPRGS